MNRGRIAKRLGERGCAPTHNGTPNEKHNDGPDSRADETSPFTGVIPAKSLAEVSGDECSDDAKQCG